ncbi:MAG: hypothetical protein L0Y44_00650 [Phycisphaerales bacterium]|nr:hypothetical protein [Phycisphaerales bacterium]MCI0629146.1 hypothetical protein [Phycisphaerales bacterium]
MTISIRNVAPACFLLGLLIFGTETDRALGQATQNDAREQNEILTQQVRALQEQLRAAEQENQRLEDRIAQLEQQLGAMRRSTTTPAPPTAPPAEVERVTIDETVPNASPRALFRALRENYEQTMGGLAIGEPGSTERREYWKRLEKWKVAVDRLHQGQFAWHVRVDSGPVNRRDRVVTFVAVDPETDVRLGDPFDVLLSRTLADRLARLEERGELGVLVMRGYLEPNVVLDPEREVKGTFDKPQFIGPFAAFDFQLVARSLLQAEQHPQEAQPAATRPASPKP